MAFVVLDLERLAGRVRWSKAQSALPDRPRGYAVPSGERPVRVPVELRVAMATEIDCAGRHDWDLSGFLDFGLSGDRRLIRPTLLGLPTGVLESVMNENSTGPLRSCKGATIVGADTAPLRVPQRHAPLVRFDTLADIRSPPSGKIYLGRFWEWASRILAGRFSPRNSCV